MFKIDIKAPRLNYLFSPSSTSFYPPPPPPLHHFGKESVSESPLAFCVFISNQTNTLS